MFSAKAQEKLGFYVYLYIDPRTNAPFYIGKGRGNRAFHHLKDNSETEKAKRIEELGRLGLEPRIEILKYGLTEREALLVESTAIDLVDIQKLTNASRGHGSRFGARGSARQIADELEARKVTVKEPGILVNIRVAFRHDMTRIDLYDATRSAWVVGSQRERARFAFAVYRGIVREVYQISSWVRGGTTMRANDDDKRNEVPEDRWEFVGALASDDVRNRYIGKSVRDYFPMRAQNPIKYVNCEQG